MEWSQSIAARSAYVHHSALLVDLGNTLCKSRLLTWGSAPGAQWQALQITDNPFELLDFSHSLESVYIASVRSDDVNAELQRQFEEKGVDFHLIKTEAQQFGLKNSYQNVSKMGVDRWLAMLGAQLFAEQSYMVIDAGTAITCDAVVNLQHLGGWIAPGYSLLQQAVTANTARVTSAEFNDSSLQFGQDTEACLHFGCIAQLQGLISAGALLMNSNTSQFHTIISGGDLQKLQFLTLPDKPFPPIFIENIVMFGLLRFAFANTPLDKLKKLATQLAR